MAYMHYAGIKIEISDDDVEKLTASQNALAKPGFHRFQFGSGTVHFVTGPGIPLLIDERRSQRGAHSL